MSVDTIIVGAGSAGAVIAARMTEAPSRQALLLEAGPDYAPSALPPDLRDGTRNSMRLHDWGYRHVPTPGQGPFRFPRGRVVGGSSAVNTCIALRGQPYDYDEWADRGLSEWGWDKCLPAFKRLENDLDVKNEWHSQDGPIPIRRHPPSELVPWQAGFLEACKSLGFPACPDHNDPSPEGYGPQPMNKVNGERMSAARCYLTDAVRRRENLRIQPDTHVRRVVTKNHRVVGIEVETNGRVETIATERVVLCAGAIATPGILLRSGIGPRASVSRIGVDSVVDLPAVGRRLLDHPGAAIFVVPRPGVTHIGHPLIQTMCRFTSEGSAYPNDMQLQAGSLLPASIAAFPFASLMCCVGKPRGSGTIQYLTANPHERPKIDSAILVDDADREAAVEAMELAWLCIRSKPMKELGYFFWPGERILRDRAKLRKWIFRSCDSGYHPCGTVPMGAESDPEAALDQYGRVRGMTGLFVADASIMPTVPSVNINVPTLMIGERFGEWFREGTL